MRLIDADKMKIGLFEKTKTDREASRFIDIIDGQNTSYDVDKVIECLKEKGNDDSCGGAGAIWLEDAIKIVKSGGVQNGD